MQIDFIAAPATWEFILVMKLFHVDQHSYMTSYFEAVLLMYFPANLHAKSANRARGCVAMREKDAVKRSAACGCTTPLSRSKLRVISRGALDIQSKNQPLQRLENEVPSFVASHGRLYA